MVGGRQTLAPPPRPRGLPPSTRVPTALGGRRQRPSGGASPPRRRLAASPPGRPGRRLPRRRRLPLRPRSGPQAPLGSHWGAHRLGPQPPPTNSTSQPEGSPVPRPSPHGLSVSVRPPLPPSLYPPSPSPRTREGELLAQGRTVNRVSPRSD